MTERQEHCEFALKNSFGRCVAICSHNSGPVDEDCTGHRDIDNSEYKRIKAIGSGEVKI